MLEASESVKKTPDFVRGMLRKQRRSGLVFDTVLADREFDNVACMRAIDYLGLKFVMPARVLPSRGWWRNIS